MPGLKTGVENGIFWSEIGSSFEERGGTPLPRIPRSTPLNLHGIHKFLLLFMVRNEGVQRINAFCCHRYYQFLAHAFEFIPVDSTVVIHYNLYENCYVWHYFWQEWHPNDQKNFLFMVSWVYLLIFFYFSFLFVPIYYQFYLHGNFDSTSMIIKKSTKADPTNGPYKGRTHMMSPC